MMKKALRIKDMKTLDKASQRIVGDSFWLLHTDKNCSVCTPYVEKDKGRRPAKDRLSRRRQHEASESTLSFYPPDFSTPKQTTIKQQNYQLQMLKHLHSRQLGLNTVQPLTCKSTRIWHKRSHVVDCRTSPVKQLQTETITDTLGKQKEEPLSKLEEKLGTSLLRRKQNSS